MKRIAGLLIALLLFAGCSSKPDQLDNAMALRAKLHAQSVRFCAQITADYGDKTYTFAMECTSDPKGNLEFTVVSPESIAGITGQVSGSGGKLTFDGAALAFELMADQQITPVSGPWVLMRALQSGYLTSCTATESGSLLSVDDSYEADALHLDVWLDGEDIPTGCDIFWKGRRLLSISVTEFSFL